MKSLLSFATDPRFRCAPLKVQALVLQAKASYLEHGDLPDDPREFAIRVQIEKRICANLWSQVRAFFRPFGYVLLDDEIEEMLIRKEKADAARRENGRLGDPRLRNVAPLPAPLAAPLVAPLAGGSHDKEHAHDASAPTCGEVLLSTQKEKDSSSAPALTGQVSTPTRKPRAKKARLLTPAQARALSLEEFAWTQDCEEQLQQARKGYPSNALRKLRSGEFNRCLPGTPEQMRRAWKEIMLDHPEVTPRELKACLFVYLSRQERDQEANIVSGIVNLPKFWAPELKMWEEFLPEARDGIARADAAQASQPQLVEVMA